MKNKSLNEFFYVFCELFKESDKIFYYYPSTDEIFKQIRIVGFCAGMVKFTQTFNPNKLCESVHTEQKRLILNEIDKNFWMVIV
jgi:hypothetical protein